MHTDSGIIYQDIERPKGASQMIEKRLDTFGIADVTVDAANVLTEVCLERCDGTFNFKRITRAKDDSNFALKQSTRNRQPDAASCASNDCRFASQVGHI